NCSSCHAPLPVDSRHCTCQACRERVASSDAESRPRGRPRAGPAAYISRLSRLHLWTLDVWTKSGPAVTPWTGSMKSKRYLL
ncbi:hypothetical protein BCV72DRAFT_310919, partial [Rhizopus microsporus var. microsporus]